MSHSSLQKASLLAVLASCAEAPPPPPVTAVGDLAQLAYGWNAEIITAVDQSYAGWDVEIGDVDNDGSPEILTGTAPDSRIYVHRARDGAWQSNLLVDRLAGGEPGLVLGLRVVDLDGNGRSELIAGTGQEDGTIAQLAVMQTDGTQITSRNAIRSKDNTSSYTHGLATADLDGDGMQDIVSSYCGNGEVIRYDLRSVTSPPTSRKVLQLSGSGEDAWLDDIDADGQLELVVSNSYRDGKARIQIHELDPSTGDPEPSPRVVIDAFEGQRMFYGSIAAGDIDNDGRPELIVGWKAEQDRNRATIVAYRIDGNQPEPEVAYVLARDDAGLDLSYFEKMIAIADLDGDGRNELVVSTRGDGESEGIDSDHLGHVYVYRVLSRDDVRRDLIVDFDPRYVESSWLPVGDADGDGRADLILATGKGDRKQAGVSWVLRLWQPGSERQKTYPPR